MDLYDIKCISLNSLNNPAATLNIILANTNKLQIVPFECLIYIYKYDLHPEIATFINI